VDGGCGGGGWWLHDAGAVLAVEVAGVGKDVEADVGGAAEGVVLALGDVHGQVAAVVVGREFELAAGAVLRWGLCVLLVALLLRKWGREIEGLGSEFNVKV